MRLGYHVIIVCVSNVMLLCSWGAFGKMYTSDNKPHNIVEVEDTEIVQDDRIADKQSDKPEESISPKQTAMESLHDRETNIEKVSPLYDSKSKDRTLETPTILFDSVSPSVNI